MSLFRPGHELIDASSIRTYLARSPDRAGGNSGTRMPADQAIRTRYIRVQLAIHEIYMDRWKSSVPSLFHSSTIMAQWRERKWPRDEFESMTVGVNVASRIAPPHH